MKKIDRIIEILRENMVANAPSTGGAFGADSPASGPTAGTDAMVGITTSYSGIKKNVDYRKVPKKYKVWVRNLDN